MTLALLILVAGWLATCLVVLGMCATAARGDRLTPPRDESGRPRRLRVTL